MNKALIFITLFVFAGLASASLMGSLHQSWEAWKTLHKKTYSVSENRARFGIFVENYKIVRNLNAQSKGITKFSLNKFADLTSAEFGALYTVDNIETSSDVVAEQLTEKKAIDLPDSVDWREKGAVNGVKDQSSCGSCWAFSATGALEATYFIKSGKLLSFSEQQIVDCAFNAGYGCQGGWPYLAVEYAAESGIQTGDDYPYRGTDGNCRFNASKAIKVTSGYKFVQPKSTDSLKAALVDSPVSVLVQADQNAFQFYSSGVLTTGCGASLNHAVLAVGYQKIGLLEAFIVKNSWSANWGDKGYIMISTIQQINNGQGVCGILAQPVIALP